MKKAIEQRTHTDTRTHIYTLIPTHQSNSLHTHTHIHAHTHTYARSLTHSLESTCLTHPHSQHATHPHPPRPTHARTHTLLSVFLSRHLSHKCFRSDGSLCDPVSVPVFFSMWLDHSACTW